MSLLLPMVVAPFRVSIPFFLFFVFHFVPHSEIPISSHLSSHTPSIFHCLALLYIDVHPPPVPLPCKQINKQTTNPPLVVRIRPRPAAPLLCPPPARGVHLRARTGGCGCDYGADESWRVSDIRVGGGGSAVTVILNARGFQFRWDWRAACGTGTTRSGRRRYVLSSHPRPRP
jgi:hypothetical protein